MTTMAIAPMPNSASVASRTMSRRERAQVVRFIVAATSAALPKSRNAAIPASSTLSPVPT